MQDMRWRRLRQRRGPLTVVAAGSTTGYRAGPPGMQLLLPACCHACQPHQLCYRHKRGCHQQFLALSALLGGGIHQ